MLTVQVVHLVRDPRGMFRSLSSRPGTWTLTESLAKKVCNDIEVRNCANFDLNFKFRFGSVNSIKIRLVWRRIFVCPKFVHSNGIRQTKPESDWNSYIRNL